MGRRRDEERGAHDRELSLTAGPDPSQTGPEPGWPGSGPVWLWSGPSVANFYSCQQANTHTHIVNNLFIILAKKHELSRDKDVNNKHNVDTLSFNVLISLKNCDSDNK